MYLLVGLVPCYPVCHLLPAFVHRGLVTTDRDSLRDTYNGIRRVRQLTLGCESNRHTTRIKIRGSVVS